MIHRNNSLIYLLVAVLALLCTAACFGAPGRESSPKVVLILADYLSIGDITTNAPLALANFTRESGVALLIPSATSAHNPEASYASASAGANCWGSEEVDGAYNAREIIPNENADAGTVFSRRTGIMHQAPIVLPELFQLRQMNKAKGAVSLPGALGDELVRAGKRVAVFGNSDPGDVPRRRAAVIGATSEGLIGMGDIGGDLLKRELLSATGYVTNVDLLARKVDDALAVADFVIVDFGDTDRVNLLREHLSDEAYRAHQASAIKNLDALLSRILSGRASKATVMLASMVAPVDSNGERRELGPVVVRRPGVGPGLLVSATTRTPGLVSAADFAPTVLRSLGVAIPRSMIGGSIDSVPGNAAQVTRLSRLVVLDRTIIVWVLAVIGGLGIVVITLGAAALAFGRARQNSVALRALLVLVSSSPLAVLFATLGEPAVVPFVTRLVAWAVALTVGSFVVAGLIVKLAGDRLRLLPGGLPVLVLMVTTCAAIFVDALLGGEFSRFTVLSAGRFDGYRFYGIGNEYMGVWLGMALVSMVWIGECFPEWSHSWRGRAVVLLISLATVAALGFPRFGANAGGAVAAVVGLGLVYKAGVARRFRARDVFILLAAGFGLVALIGIADVMLSHGAPSHIGRAAAISGTVWHSYLGTMAIRKVSMNLALIATQQGKLALLGSVPFFAMWFWVIRRRFDALAEGRPAFRCGLAGVLVASLVAFIFNDSGIVAWGLIVGYLSMAVVYSLIESERSKCTE